MSPRTIDPLLTALISIKATRVTEKMSKGPKRTEISANGGARVARKTHETSPPIKDDTIPNPRARPGWPFLAIGNPSSTVIMAAGVPGIRISVAEIRPPLVEPTYIETSRTSAERLSMK